MRVNNDNRKSVPTNQGFRNIVFGKLQKQSQKRSRESRNLSWQISTRYYIHKFGLKFREADRISHFIYMLNGEEDRTFLKAMETWVREVALVNGTAREVIDAISILSVCRIDPEKTRTCRTVSREVIRYVRSRFTASHPIRKTIGKRVKKAVSSL